MNPFVINSFSPKAEILARTATGNTYSLTNAAISLSTIRSTDGGAGAFHISLTADKDSHGLMWSDKIRPMDYIEIRAGNKLVNGKPPMRMRGFVDFSGEQFLVNQTGGPTRSMVVTGRDYTKLFMSQNIQYLWSQSLSTDGNYPGLALNFGVPADGQTTVMQIMNTILQDVFLGKGPKGRDLAFLPNYRMATGINIPDIVPFLIMPSQFQAQFFAIGAYTGAFWNLMQYLVSAPLGELFFYDTEQGPIMTFRVAPLKDQSGKIVPPAQNPELSTIKLDTAVASAYNIGRSDQDVLNYFFSLSDAASSGGGSSAPAFMSPNIDLETWTPYAGGGTGKNPYWNPKSVRKFGLRPLNVETPWLQLINLKDLSAVQVAVQLSNYLGAVYGHNEELLSGTIVCHGDENLIPGRYMQFNGHEYYLEQVQDDFEFKGSSSPSWTATLTVTRGQ